MKKVKKFLIALATIEIISCTSAFASQLRGLPNNINNKDIIENGIEINPRPELYGIEINPRPELY
jgi:hypothetical protein